MHYVIRENLKLHENYPRVAVAASRYMKADGPIALIIVGVDENGKPNEYDQIAVATVNTDHSQDNSEIVFIKNWSENEGIEKWLEREAIVKLTGKAVDQGFVEALEAKIVDPELRKEIS